MGPFLCPSDSPSIECKCFSPARWLDTSGKDLSRIKYVGRRKRALRMQKAKRSTRSKCCHLFRFVQFAAKLERHVVAIILSDNKYIKVVIAVR